MREEKKRKAIDEVLGKMVGSATEQCKKFEQKEQEYEAKIRNMDTQINTIKKLVKNRQPSKEQKSLMLQLLRRRKLFDKQRERYANMQLQTDATKARLEDMRTNTDLLKQNDQLVTGMKELAKMGINVKGVESKLDSADDVMDEISEFNVAFAREPLETALSEEEQQSLEAELEAEFASDLHSVSISAPRFKTRLPVETEELTTEEKAEAELAAMVMAEL